MRSTSTPSFLTTSTAFLALLELVSATYFTSPQASTVWQAAPGQVITWHYQAGGAAVGDIVLQANGLGGAGATVTVASQVDLTTESLTFPSGVALRSNTGQYELKIVNSQDPSFAYTEVGPFSIESFSGSASSSPSSSSSSDKSSSSTVQQSAGSPHTETNPPVSTPVSQTTTSPLQTVTRSDSSSSSTTTTTTSARPTTTSSSSSSSSSEEDSSSSTSEEETSTTSSSVPLSTATVLSTASVVEITSTMTTSGRTATIISATRPSSTSGAASSAIKTGGIVGALTVAAMGMSWLM
ncbi:hypothetical protein JCM5350_007650 [Sporobolomyces pararoseus]